MPRIIFHEPSGNLLDDPTEQYLRGMMLAPAEDYWIQGSGDAEVEYVTPEAARSSLLILPHSELGFSLRVLVTIGHRIVQTWLSLADRSKLLDVVDCGDEWLASSGLFLGPAAAAEAVVEFARSGRRTPDVTWIPPTEIPAGGNW